MHRRWSFGALALTSCGAILGLDEPEFVRDDGGTNASNESGTPNDDGAADARSDVAASDASFDAGTTRLREMTFEEGAVVGGLTGASSASSVVITQGLRGNFAAKAGGPTSWIRWNAPAPQQELWIAFRWKCQLISLADQGSQPQVMRIFRADGQPVVELFADANERLVMRLKSQQTPPSSLKLAPGDLVIGVHVVAKEQGLAEVWIADAPNNGIGLPFAQLMGEIDLMSGVDLGSSTALGKTPFSQVILDDVIVDTKKLVTF